MSSSQLAGFSGHYSPGGGTGNARRRAWARASGRKGGLEAGRRRRALARGRRRTRDGGLGVPKAYAPVPWLSREATERVFRRLCETEGRRFHQGGYETFDAVYRVLKRWSIAKGQGFELTNENVSAALRALGRPHSRRTVQYTHRRLAASGVLELAHVKRSGPRRIPGRMDTLRCHLRRVATSKDCTLPLRGTGQRSYVASWPVRPSTSTAGTASSPPASPADGVAARAANVNDGTERGGAAKDCTPPAESGPDARIAELEAALAFAELKAERPGLREQQLPKIRRIQMELRALREGRDARLYAERPEQSPRLRWRGERC